MHSQEILALAQQGNPQVLTAIINHAMQSYGVQARVVRREPCLHILLEAPQTPEQQSSVSFVQRLFRNFGVNSLQSVRIYGHRLGDPKVDWQQDVEIQTEPTPEGFVNPFAIDPEVSVVEAPITSEIEVKPVMAEVMPPQDASPSEVEDLFRRPETVVLVFLLSLITLWDLYLELTDEPETSSLTTGKLAQRLRVSRRILRRQKQDINFDSWSRSRDPEGIAWQWQAGAGFIPCQVSSGA